MGKTAYNVVLGRGVAAIKGNEFIFQVLTKMDLEGFWKKLSAGSTFESLNSDNIINAKINLPSNLEQDKIGSLFEKIDNLITLHQCESCKKVAAVQSAFARRNLSKWADSWEQRKAKELCSISTGKSNTQDQVDDGKYPFYIRSDIPVRSNITVVCRTTSAASLKKKMI